jgi:hypothetical protein
LRYLFLILGIFLIIVTFTLGCVNTTSDIQSNGIGLSKETAAPLGTTVSYTKDYYKYWDYYAYPTPKTYDLSNRTYFGKYSVNITIEEVIRGSDAQALMDKDGAYVIKSDYLNGTEPFLLKLKLEIVKTPSSNISILINSWGLYTNNSYSPFNHPAIIPVVPHPMFKFHDLHEGDISEGWIGFFIYPNETSPILKFDINPISKTAIWLKTT